MATTSSRFQEAAGSSLSPKKKEMRCAPSSVPSKTHQSKTPTTMVRSALLRPSPRRRSNRSTQGLRRLAFRVVPHQDQRSCLGRFLPSHRKARPVPFSGRAQGLSSGGPLTLPTSRRWRFGTIWRRASWHVSLRRTHGKERPALRSSSPRPLRSFRKQERFAATAAHLALLPTQVRVESCVSVSTYEGSTEPHLRSASGLRAWDAARVRHTATFACLSACQTRLPPTSVTYRAFWRLRRSGITLS